ncbi:MAG: phosphorylase, partial [Betaproteobacteria bacterium]|nr:phosphorylase [Betaproteobacteria bacterium]
MSIEPGTLWNAVRARTRHALGCGALRPIEIETRVVQQEGIPFLVRVATNLRRKDAARAEHAESSRAAGKAVDPFQPYEEDLFVTDLPPSHFCLLNKYNVIDHHLLIITRDYADQEELITPEDFAALWACLAEIDGVGLYNGGKTAGASQPHKHLQLVPVPLAAVGAPIPIERAFDRIPPGSDVTRSDRLPFRHAFARLDPSHIRTPATAAEETFRLYRAMLAAMGIKGVAAGGVIRQSAAYNLLLTRRWLLL